MSFKVLHPDVRSVLLLCGFFIFNMSLLNISSLNVNGARDVLKRSLIFQQLKVKRTEVAFLQETHSDSNNENDWKREWEGQVVLSHLSTTSGGVGITFSKSFTPDSLEVEDVVEGRLLVVRAEVEQFYLVFMNVYAPVSRPDRVRFFKVLDTV